MIPFNFHKSDPHGLYWIGGQYTIGHGPDGWRIFSPLAPKRLSRMINLSENVKATFKWNIWIWRIPSQIILTVALTKIKVPSYG